MLKILDLLNETVQMAKKKYFDDNLIDNEGQNIILNITNRDNYTKFISDFYYQYMNYNFKFKRLDNSRKNIFMLRMYEQIKEYNKNKLPIRDFNDLNKGNDLLIFKAFEERFKCMRRLNYLPSVAKRNLKEDIRKLRTYEEMRSLRNTLDIIVKGIKLLDNRPENIRREIYKKMFRKGYGFEDVLDFINQKENIVGGVEFDKESIIELANNDDGIDVIVNNDKHTILKIDNADSVKTIGCNSLWCFTYGKDFEKASKEWESYSHNGIVYVIIIYKNKNDVNFMNVLTKPIDKDGNKYDYSLFSLDNLPIEDPIAFLNKNGINNYEDVFTFD